MGVARGGAYSPMPEELPDHGKALPEGEGAGREGVAKIVDADVFEAGPGAKDLPRILKVLQGSARVPPGDEPGIARDPGQARDHLRRGR